jgi:hypothetical protein
MNEHEHEHSVPRELIPGGRYWIPLTAYEFVCMPYSGTNEGIRYVLTPPHDCTYPDAPSIVVLVDGTLHTGKGTLAYTIDDLNYGGSVYDWATRTTRVFQPPWL